MMSDRHSHFYRGAQVEVLSTEAGSYGTRYEATLLDSPSPRSSKRRTCRVLVEYRTLLSDEDGSQPLRELVDLSLLRPRPPPPADHPSLSGRFKLCDVVDAYYKGGWLEGIVNAVIGAGDEDSVSVLFQSPAEQIPFPTSRLRLHLDWVDGEWIRPQTKRLEEIIFSSGASVEVNLEIGVGTDAAWIPAKVLKETGNNSYLVEYQSSSKGVVGEHQQKTVDIHHIRPVPPRLEKIYIGLLDRVEAFFDFGWRCGVVTKLLPDERYKVFFKDRAKMFLELSRSELRLPLIWKFGRWLTSKDVISSLPDGQQEQERTGFKNGQKTEMSTRPIKKLKDGHEEVLPKCQPEEQLHGLANSTTIPCYGYISSKKSLVDDPSSNAERPLQDCKKEFIVEQESGLKLKLPLKTRGRNRKSLRKHNRNGGGSDMAVEHSKSTVGEAGSDSQTIVNQGNETSGRDEKLEAPVIHAKCDSAQVGDESFCFAKKSPFWKQFDAMPLFKKMPQNPHFNPLKDIKEGFREGRAIGYMAGFIDMAEQAAGLTIDDPRSTFDNLLENLRELEVVGFDVKALQDQVKKVLTVKLKKSNLLILTQEIGKRLAEHEQEKAECDEKEDELEKAMKELKEKHAAVVAKKKSEEFEITVLRSCITDLEETMNHLGK